MRTSPRIAAAALAVAAGLVSAPIAAAEPPPPPPRDCGIYGEINKALEAAGEHLSPPLGTPSPAPPGFRADPPQRCL